jgi:hypothetical protein
MKTEHRCIENAAECLCIKWKKAEFHFGGKLENFRNRTLIRAVIAQSV